MNDSFQIETIRPQGWWLDQYNSSNSLGQGHCIQPYQIQPYIYTCHCPVPTSPHDFEIQIEQIGTGEPVLNYGAKLRLIMADPIKGHDLREAIAKLKIALKEIQQCQ